VTLPAIAPQVITTLRVTAGLSWLVVVAAEMIAGRDGLGFAVWDARNGLRIDLLVAAMFVIGVIGASSRPPARAAHEDPERALGLRALMPVAAQLLRLDQVVVSYGEVGVLAGIDLEVRDGEFVAIVGPSGCGKTTLLNVCSGWLSPTSGRVDRPAALRWCSAGRPVPVAHRGGERAARPRPGRRSARTAAAGERAAGADRAHLLREQLSAPALGRDAAARGAGARAGGRDARCC
jgi:hypothetical protein